MISRDEALALLAENHVQAGLLLDAFLALSIAAMRDCFSQPA